MKSKIVSSMEKIMPMNEPLEAENSNRMFKNEKLNFQIAVKNDTPDQCKMNTIVVKGDLAEFVTLRTVELVPSFYCPTQTDNYYITTEPGVFPDKLKPMTEIGFSVTPNQWRGIWVTIFNEDGLPNGVHRLVFDILNEKKESVGELAYEVTVIDEFLPKSDLVTSNWMHYDCIAQQHRVEPFTDEFYAVFEKYLKAYVDCGNNTLLVPLFTPPLDTLVGGERKTCQLVSVRKEGNTYEFDFDKLEYFIRFVLERGVSYLEFSHLFTQWGGAHPPKIVATADGEEKKIFGWDDASDCEEYKAFLNEFLPALVNKIHLWNLQDRIFFHLTDEPQESQAEAYAKCREMVKAHVGKIPIVDALSDYSFYEKGLIEIPCVQTPFYKKFREKGVKNCFAYYCCCPTDGYYSNRILNIPLQRTRILGLQLYENGAKGFMHWGFNFYNTAYSLSKVDPNEDTSAGGLFPSGDSFIVYPNEDNVIMTIRAESMYEAYQDYRLCKLAEAYLGEEKTREILQRAGICDFNVYPRSVSAHKRIRETLIENIIERKCRNATCVAGENQG